MVLPMPWKNVWSEHFTLICFVTSTKKSWWVPNSLWRFHFRTINFMQHEWVQLFLVQYYNKLTLSLNPCPNSLFVLRKMIFFTQLCKEVCQSSHQFTRETRSVISLSNLSLVNGAWADGKTTIYVCTRLFSLINIWINSVVLAFTLLADENLHSAKVWREKVEFLVDIFKDCK